MSHRPKGINTINDILHKAIQSQVEDIVKEELEKAKDEVERRVLNMVPSITTTMFERLDYSVSEHQLVFKIKPNVEA